MKLFSLLCISMMKCGSSINYVFYNFNFFRDNKNELQDLFNSMILYFMFEHTLIGETDLFTDIFIESILKKDHIFLFDRVQKYVKRILEKKIFFGNTKALLSQQTNIIKFFLDINSKNLNKKTLQCINELCMKYQNIKFTFNEKNVFLKEFFYIFVKESNFRVLRNKKYFYMNSILYFEILVCETYVLLNNNYLFENNIIITYEILKKNHTDDQKNKVYLLNMKAIDHVFICFKQLIFETFIVCKDKNCTISEFYEELKKNYISCYKKETQTMHKEINFRAWKKNIKKFEILQNDLNVSMEIYLFNYNEDLIANTIEFWFRDYFNMNKNMIELSKQTFLHLYKNFYMDLKCFLSENILNPVLIDEKNLHTHIFIYKSQ